VAEQVTGRGTSSDGCELLCLDLPHAEQVRDLLSPQSSGAALEAASVRAKALGDPTRLRVAAALATGGQMCGCDLAWVTDLARNLVSHHLRTLRAAGLASSTRAGKLVMYRLTPAGQALLTVVLGDQVFPAAADGSPAAAPATGAAPATA